MSEAVLPPEGGELAEQGGGPKRQPSGRAFPASSALKPMTVRERETRDGSQAASLKVRSCGAPVSPLLTSAEPSRSPKDGTR